MAWDTFVMLDWSGGNDRGAAPKADAIWACIAGQAPLYFRNRQRAEEWLSALLEAEQAAGRRTFVGFDFPFGYPTGFGEALAGSSDPLALWDWLEARIHDSPKANNRFDLAGEINAAFPGTGPFWANGLRRDIPHLPRKQITEGHGLPEKRLAEQRAKGAFTLWQLAGAGAVGSQSLMGLPVLARLRRRFDVAVWPFEPLDRAVAFVEIWPSLFTKAVPDGWIKDAWQVHCVARRLSSLPQAQLVQMLDVPATPEGWIFGIGHEETLQADAAPRLRNDCFALPQGTHWTPVDEALALLKERLSPVTDPQPCPLDNAAGRVLAENVYAVRAHPPLANTAVDGFGFAGARGAGAHVLPLVAHRAAAGEPAPPVPAGHAIKVLTGAVLPAGVDTVLLQEDVTVGPEQIAFYGPVKAGLNTRKAGEDLKAGGLALPAGTRLGPAELALLAATGAHRVTVRTPLRVGVLSTGTELIPNGTRAELGQVFDANRPMLLSLLQSMGHQPVDLGIAPDDRQTLAGLLDQSLGHVDAILTSGGASASEEDHLSALLRSSGSMHIWRVAMKPGRPLALGQWGGVPVFGLPGNPVAAFVCALIFARPALGLLAGAGWQEPVGFQVPAAFAKSKRAGRREYLRARVRDGKAEIFASEGSGRISGLSWAEGLVELPDQALEIKPGDSVRYLPFKGLW